MKKKAEENEDIIFDDGESIGSYSNDGVTFKEIVLQHLRQITRFSSVEFRGGYTQQKAVNTGGITNVVETYIPDTLEVYSNAVECFADMLCPYFDTTMTAAGKSCTAEIKKSYDSEFKTKEEKRTAEAKETTERYVHRINKRNANKKLFRALCCFLHRKKYLDVGSIED